MLRNRNAEVHAARSAGKNPRGVCESCGKTKTLPYSLRWRNHYVGLFCSLNCVTKEQRTQRGEGYDYEVSRFLSEKINDRPEKDLKYKVDLSDETARIKEHLRKVTMPTGKCSAGDLCFAKAGKKDLVLRFSIRKGTAHLGLFCSEECAALGLPRAGTGGTIVGCLDIERELLDGENGLAFSESTVYIKKAIEKGHTPKGRCSLGDGCVRDGDPVNELLKWSIEDSSMNPANPQYYGMFCCRGCAEVGQARMGLGIVRHLDDIGRHLVSPGRVSGPSDNENVPTGRVELGIGYVAPTEDGRFCLISDPEDLTKVVPMDVPEHVMRRGSGKYRLVLEKV